MAMSVAPRCTTVTSGCSVRQRTSITRGMATAPSTTKPASATRTRVSSRAGTREKAHAAKAATL